MTELAWREEAICGRCNSAVTYVSMYIYIYENVIAARTISTGAHAGRVDFRTTSRVDESDKPGLRRRGAASRVSRRIVMQGHGAGRVSVIRRRRLVSQRLGARNALGDGPSPDSLSKRLRRSTPTSLRQRALRRHMRTWADTHKATWASGIRRTRWGSERRITRYETSCIALDTILMRVATMPADTSRINGASAATWISRPQCGLMIVPRAANGNRVEWRRRQMGDRKILVRGNVAHRRAVTAAHETASLRCCTCVVGTAPLRAVRSGEWGKSG